MEQRGCYWHGNEGCDCKQPESSDDAHEVAFKRALEKQLGLPVELERLTERHAWPTAQLPQCQGCEGEANYTRTASTASAALT
jgi:hypothetical protein